MEVFIADTPSDPNPSYGGVSQLVDGVVWDHVAAGSSPVSPIMCERRAI